jgi:hypothetical protein
MCKRHINVLLCIFIPWVFNHKCSKDWTEKIMSGGLSCFLAAQRSLLESGVDEALCLPFQNTEDRSTRRVKFIGETGMQCNATPHEDWLHQS